MRQDIYVTWKCRKDYGREVPFAINFDVDEGGNMTDIRENGCENMNGDEVCKSCRAAAFKHFSENS